MGKRHTARTEPGQPKTTMNATTLTRSAISTAWGIAQAIAIFTLAPESTRQREIAAAKRSIAERKAQIVNRTAEIETELEQLKREIDTAPTPEPIPPNPWELETENPPTPVAIATVTPAAPVTAAPKAKKTAKPKPPTAPKPTPAATKELTIRELKASASQRKIKGYGKMTKLQLIEALKG